MARVRVPLLLTKAQRPRQSGHPAEAGESGKAACWQEAGPRTSDTGGVGSHPGVRRVRWWTSAGSALQRPGTGGVLGAQSAAGGGGRLPPGEGETEVAAGQGEVSEPVTRDA